LFGGGAFAIDPTKFNFSAYTPEPKKEVVTDPVAVVSNNSPTPDVEVLEGAGTVAVTQPDPVQQAINDLQGKDLTESFSVNPLASIEEQIQIAPLTSNIPVSSGEATNASFLDVGAGQTGVSSNIDYDVGAEQAFDLLDGSLDSNDKIKEINEYLKGEQFGEYVSEYDSRLSMLGDYDRVGGATTNLLNQVGLSKALGVEGEYGGSKLYNYNPETNQYELVRDTEKSMLEAAAPDIVVGLATAAATAGLGSALGAATGATGAIGTATTNAVASATIQQLTTGEIDPTKVALAALGGAVEGAEVADAAANSDLAGAFADFGAGSAEYAEALLAANEATATLELLTDISTGIDVVTAIEDRNLGRAFDLTAGLLDSPTLYDTVAGQLSGVIPEEYLDAATNALIRGGSTAVQGGDVSEVFQDAGNEFLINQFTTEEAIQERFGFEGQWAETATRTLSALGTDTLNGENSQDIALNGLQTFLDNAIRLIPEGEDSSSYLAEAERWWHENVEDPLQGWWQEIGDTRRALEQPFRDAYGVVTRIGGAAWDAIDLGIRALPTTKEDWQGAANFASGLIPELPDLPDLPDVPDLPDLPDIPDLPDVPDLPDLPDLPSVDVELTNSISNVDYFYDDSDIVRNPLLSSGNTRIQDLVSTIQSAEVGNGQKGRRGALVDDEDKRIKRSKGVLNLGLEANVS
jgi:hypothetical protein